MFARIHIDLIPPGGDRMWCLTRYPVAYSSNPGGGGYFSLVISLRIGYLKSASTSYGRPLVLQKSLSSFMSPSSITN